MERYGNTVFSILDPTGNITALVESETPIDRQPSVAAGIMALYEDVEQVGFVDFGKVAINAAYDKYGSGDRIDCRLRMAGGESCGNATMSAAVLYHLRKNDNRICGDDRDDYHKKKLESCPEDVGTGCSEDDYISVNHRIEDHRIVNHGSDEYVAVGHVTDNHGINNHRATLDYIDVTLSVSGASEPVEVRIYHDGCDTGSGSGSNPSLREDTNRKARYRTSILMPEAISITEDIFSFVMPDGVSISATLPVVRMEGISHIIVEENSPFYFLCQEDGLAEKAIRSWQMKLGADGLGIMFLGTQKTGMNGMHGMNSIHKMQETQDSHSMQDMHSMQEMHDMQDLHRMHDMHGIQEMHRIQEMQELYMRPLVYIPCGDTMFWENSCASGTGAVGMYFAWRKGQAVELRLHEPGGCLKVQSDPDKHKTRLTGNVCLKADAVSLQL